MPVNSFRHPSTLNPIHPSSNNILGSTWYNIRRFKRYNAFSLKEKKSSDFTRLADHTYSYISTRKSFWIIMRCSSSSAVSRQELKNQSWVVLGTKWLDSKVLFSLVYTAPNNLKRECRSTKIPYPEINISDIKGQNRVKFGILNCYLLPSLTHSFRQTFMA